jgi:hypothetical protein
VPPQRVALELLFDLVGGGPLGQDLGGPLTVPAPPPPAGGGVDQDPARIRLDGLDLAQSLPRQIGLREGGLQEILGRGPVTGQQVSRAQQGGGARRDELAELLLHFLPAGRQHRLPMTCVLPKVVTAFRREPWHGWLNQR